MQNTPSDDAHAWADRLEQLGFAVRRELAHIGRDDERLRQRFEHTGGDTVFGIDRSVEATIVAEIESWPAECKPLVLIAEGFGETGRMIFSSSEGDVRYRMILDPIDGSRSLMYDKRSAWFLAAVARDRGEDTRLRDTFAAAMVELPTSKQGSCDSYVATSEVSTIGKRSQIAGESVGPLRPRPSTASDLRQGFAQVSNFFPGTKVLASELMERIATSTVGSPDPGRALIFDDQYLSTGGQMVELIAGHDRFCCDLRPLFYEILERRSGNTTRGLECHPYDVAASLVAQQAGVILTNGFGDVLDCALDVTTPVHWCGYANQAIASKVQPVIAQWLRERGVEHRS